MTTIGITDYVQPPANIEQKAFPQAQFVFLEDYRNSDAAARQWRAVDAILAWHHPINDDALQLLTNCRIIVRYGVGYDTIDVAAVERHRKILCNTPDYGTEEVADTTCAYILALVRKIGQNDHQARFFTQGWQENVIKPQQRTSQLTLGLIGVGRIGTAVAIRMKPFGLNILGYDPYQPSGHEKAVGYERCYRLEEMLSRCDIVSVHCPLSDETRGMIDSSFLAQMKAGATLVNTARGKILADLDCVHDALVSGQLYAAAFDVLPDEPPRPHPLLDAWRRDGCEGRLLINPHAAYYSEQGWYEMRYKAAETARLFLQDGIIRNRIV